jgi:hypothetical protein
MSETGDHVDMAAIRAMLDAPEHVDTSEDYLRRIDATLGGVLDMATKAAFNAEEIRKQNEVFAESVHNRLRQMHDSLKTIGWLAGFAAVGIAAIKWHWGE